MGGIVLIKEALHLSDRILIGYLILSTAAFLVNIWLSLREVIRMRRSLGEDGAEAKQLDTNRLGPADERKSLEPVANITKDTTRAFEPAPKEQVIR
jgi:hypothetical protein